MLVDGIDVSRMGGLPIPAVRSSSGASSNNNSFDNNDLMIHPQRAELKLHKPGVITSVHVTLAETTSSRHCHEVNLKRVLQKYGITRDKQKGFGKWAEIEAQKQLEENHIALDATTATATTTTATIGHSDSGNAGPSKSSDTSSPFMPNKDDALPPPPSIPEIRRKRDNPYDNIIEKLERKYIFKQQIVSPDKSSDGNSPLDSGNGGGGYGKKKSRTGDHRDYYDETDPFIDDSELIDEIENTVRTKVLETKTGGFFVSSGHLDVVIGSGGVKRDAAHESAPKINDVAVKKKKTSKTGSVVSSAIDTTLSSSTGVGDAASAISSPLPALEREASSSSSLSNTNTISTSQENIASPGSVVPGDSTNPTTGEGKKQGKPKVDRPLWNPSQEAIAALGLFKKKVDDYISFNNTSVAKPPKNVYPRALDKDLYEVDKVIMKYHKHHSKYSGYHETLCEIVGAMHPDFHISTAVMKTAIKRVNAAEKATIARDKYNSMLTALEEEIRANIETAPSEGDQIKTAIAAKEKAKNRKAEKEIQENKGNHGKQSENVEDVPIKTYKLQLKWNPSLRSSLFALDAQCRQYVEDENAWRALLQASDRKILENEADGEPLVEKEAIEEMLNKVQSFCPMSCMNTDIKYFRSVITAERHRVKKTKEKELQGKPSASDLKSSSTGALTGESNTNGSSNVELQKKLEAERLVKANAIKDAIAASALIHTSSSKAKVGKVLKV